MTNFWNERSPLEKLTTFIFISLLAAKLTGDSGMSWWWVVMAPLLVYVGAFVFVLAYCLVMMSYYWVMHLLTKP